MDDIERQELTEQQNHKRQEWLRCLRAVGATPEGLMLFAAMLTECERSTATNNALSTSYNCGRREAFREIIQDLRATSFDQYLAVVRSQEERNHA